MENLEDLLDDAFANRIGDFTFTGYDKDYIASQMAQDIVNAHSESIYQIIRAEIVKRLVAQDDVIREMLNLKFKGVSLP